MKSFLLNFITFFRGTKYQRFPYWLDRWLKMRKELGLLMLLSATYHFIIYALMFAPNTPGVTDYSTYRLNLTAIGLPPFSPDFGETQEDTVALLRSPGQMILRMHFYLVKRCFTQELDQ